MMASIYKQRDILDAEQQTAQGQLQLSIDAFVFWGYLQILKISSHFLTKSVQPKRYKKRTSIRLSL